MINDNIPVVQGQVLLQIDPREYKAEVDQARALLDVTKAEANSAELQIDLTLSLIHIYPRMFIGNGDRRRVLTVDCTRIRRHRHSPPYQL